MQDFNVKVNIDSKDLAAPVSLLIKKICDGVKGLSKSHLLIKKAKAETQAELIRVQGRIEVEDIERRAMRRVALEECQYQSNMEDISRIAFDRLRPEANPDGVEDDWITNFFDKCRTVSTDQMQRLWGAVLAGEANVPTSFSRKTVNIVADMDTRDALGFETLCRFCCVVDGRPSILRIGPSHDIYESVGFNAKLLSDLEGVGLISSFEKHHNLRVSNQNTTITYFDSAIRVRLKNSLRPTIPMGNIRFTRAGAELSSIARTKPVNGFVEWLVKELKSTAESIEVCKYTSSS